MMSWKLSASNSGVEIRAYRGFHDIVKESAQASFGALHDAKTAPEPAAVIIVSGMIWVRTSAIV
jgi:hypothetical protein